MFDELDDADLIGFVPGAAGLLGSAAAGKRPVVRSAAAPKESSFIFLTYWKFS